MNRTYYNITDNKLKLLKFYPNNEVRYLSKEGIDFDNDTKENLEIMPSGKYKENEGNIIFNIWDNYYDVLKQNDDLIVERTYLKNGHYEINRFSPFEKYPNVNDIIDIENEFYPIILLPNKIIQNLKKDIKEEDIYKQLNVSKPTLVEKKYPPYPKKHKIVKKENNLNLNEGCHSLLYIPMALFFLYMGFYGLTNGYEIIGLILLGLVIFLIFTIFNFKTTTKEVKVDKAKNEYDKELDKYYEQEELIDNENKKIVRKYKRDLKKFENSVQSKIQEAKEKIYLSNLKPFIIESRDLDKRKKGSTELYFLDALFEKFGSQIKVDCKLENHNITYYPDFVFRCEKTGLTINIEIDEPYSYKDKEPIHFIGSNDKNRNRYFQRNNWCVIRFSEEQVKLETKNCIKLIENVVNNLLNKNRQFNSNLINQQKRWSYEESLIMAHRNMRKKY